MGKTSKYEPLRQFLKNSPNTITLSINDLEKILGFSLPKSALIYSAWWANDDFHSHSRMWLDAGMIVKNVRLNKSTTFTKNKIE